MQLKQRHVALDARLGEREEVRAQAHVAVVAEDRAGERQQRALEVGERDVLVDREALDLVELRRVRGVVVAPVGAAGDDDVQRRRAELHRAHLHRRGVRAQDDVVGDVERVALQPRRVLRRVVERVEVVVDELGLRALDDAEAEADEDVLDLAPGGGDQVVAADRRDRAAGQRDVEHVGGQARLELGALERLAGAPRSRRRARAAPRWRRGRPRRAPPAAAARRRAAGSAARPCGRGSARARPRARPCPWRPPRRPRPAGAARRSGQAWPRILRSSS